MRPLRIRDDGEKRLNRLPQHLPIQIRRHIEQMLPLYPQAVIEQRNSGVPTRAKVQMHPFDQALAQSVVGQPAEILQPHINLLAHTLAGRHQRFGNALLNEPIQHGTTREGG